MLDDETVKKVIEGKANAMKRNPKYGKYMKEFAQEIKDPEKAFLAGAIDAMAFDVAALTKPRLLLSYEKRKKLIKAIMGI